MKPLKFRQLALSMLVAATPVLFTQVSAQDVKKEKEKKGRVHIRISEEKDGRMKNTEKSYEVGSLSDKERDALIDKVLDSLGTDKSRKQSISITFDDGDTRFTQDRKKIIMDRRDDREPLVWNYEWSDDLAKTLRDNADLFRDHYRNFERDFGPKAKDLARNMEDFGNRMGEAWDKNLTKPANVRALNIYPNNPDNGQLNLRFAVPDKGDVTIVVTDVKGREVGKKEIKDFEGEFVGQIELKKNTKGTVFVSVVQNEDGAVKRVVIP
jgi:hypothetical protein